MRRLRGALAIVGVLTLVAAACNNNNAPAGGGNPSGGGAQVAGPPTADMPVLQTIGPGEGKLNLIAWAGYVKSLDPKIDWLTPFENQTGCIVHETNPNTSDEFVALLKDGGGGQWDLASTSGDADLRVIYGGDVRPVNIDLIPAVKDFSPAFQAPAFNTIDGVHYGVSLQWGPNILMYDPATFPTAPTSWSVVYDPKYKGQITVPDNPIQIADAALYLQKTQPDLGITDPYELTQPQFDAAINLLKQQQPLVKKYWTSATQEINAFANGDVTVGAAWPYQQSTLEANGTPIASTIPDEGATGWADSWLLATKAPHPNCAYMWMQYISTPKVQAMQAVTYGETPDNSLACKYMDQLSKGSCAQYHANAPSLYLDSIALWKTPIATCDDGTNNCVPYSQWAQAWTTEVTG